MKPSVWTIGCRCKDFLSSYHMLFQVFQVFFFHTETSVVLILSLAFQTCLDVILSWWIFFGVQIIHPLSLSLYEQHKHPAELLLCSLDYYTLSFSCTGKLSHYLSGTRTAILHHCYCFAALYFIFPVNQAQAAELLNSLAINLSLFDCWDFIALQLTQTALQLTATATSASSIRLGDVYQRRAHRCSKVVSVLTCSSEPKCRYGCVSLIPPRL